VITARRTVAIVWLTAAGCRSFTDPPVTKGLTAFSAPDSLIADGTSTVTISASIDTLVTGTTRTVVFQATAGAFLPNGSSADTATADSTGKAIATLRSPRDTGTATVSVTYANNSRIRQINFFFAPADSMRLTPSAFNVVTGPNDDTITALLRRNYGFPSAGIAVKFAAHDTAGASRGEITSIAPSDSTGTAVALFSPLDTTYIGIITLTASATFPGGSVSDSIQIAVTPAAPSSSARAVVGTGRSQ
jgi:hypothetical protein